MSTTRSEWNELDSFYIMPNMPLHFSDINLLQDAVAPVASQLIDLSIESQDLHLNNNNSLLTSTAATTTLVTADSHENKGTITILMPPKTPLIFLDLSTQIYRCCELDEETKPDCFLNLNLDIAKCVWSWSIYL